MASPPRNAALYLRISLDQTGEGLAIDRQREECERIAAQRGWTVVGVYEDRSISATQANKKRPGYEQLVSAYQAGQFDAMVCYDLDRLTRQPRQLEDWIEAAEGRGLALVTANGEADLTTDGGRMFARVKLAVARSEVERKSARQRTAAHQRASLGRPPLGTRLTGYTPKGETIPAEAEVIRRIFKLFQAGETLRSITRMLTEEGVTTRRGNAWNPSTIYGTLTNPRYAGRAVYQGKPTGQLGNWEPLVSPEVFDLIQARLADPRRKTNRVGTDRKHLGSGLYVCAVCEQPTTSWSQGRYRCKDSHVNRAQSQVDSYVLDTIAARLRRGDIATLLAPAKADLAPLLDDIERLTARQATIDADYDAGLIDGTRHAAATATVRAELIAVQQQMAAADKGSALGELLTSPDPAQAFLDAGLMTQRSAIDALAVVRLHRGHRYSRTFDPETVEVDWRRPR
ncbi:recombinase family protein [Mycobacteroides abscessus]|uniref:recombinase family protein n=1 Tax=Mycobacteroides abscessus TaxID=36809 RepID=UPI000C265E06|nr:recombinase family protein [Mycobacteroides abscessus]MDM2493480.1 recombinase family protein [Mycobacteroides abscessus]MDM2514426.1 recombinase family protein [Mycobacteroides abscessus]MDM2523786.1 recombinase family protein [Mycobacteroides abscessus]MDM2528209.1 recombinase family protein [Mycobacteroides abscessus]MDM2531561.1 recombinase family protein [Mycobacteroides abscessus]